MKVSKEYNYDNKYYDEGIGGFHKNSIPFLHKYFNSITLGKADLKIIDFGCGNGFHGKYLRSIAKELQGVDFSDAIQSSPNKIEYDILYKRDLGNAINLPENYFDFIFSIEVVEHVEDYKMFLVNARKVLKPGGQIFLTTTTYFWSIFLLFSVYWSKFSIENLVLFFKGLFGTDADKTKFVIIFWDFFTGHYHGFSKKQLTDVFIEMGFTIKEIKYLPIQDTFPVHTLKRPLNNWKNIVAFIPMRCIWIIGLSINYFFKKTGIYAPNILIVAEK